MQKIKQAVILAGGQGTRLRPLTEKVPKPMVRINGKPFVQYIVENLKKNSIKEIIFLTGYLGEQIENYFGDGKKFGVKIKYSHTPVEYKNGSRIKEAFDLYDDLFLLLYCDNYWPLNLKQLENFYEKNKRDALVTIYSNKDNYTKNTMFVNSKNLVETYDKTRKTAGLNGVDISFFILKKAVLKHLPKENFSFEKVIIPELIKKKQLSGFLTDQKYYGLSNLERIPVIKKYLKPKKIIFLDRDGVINKKPPKAEYVTTPDDFKILPNTITALKLLMKHTFEIYVVTNQAGIGRGKMTEKDLKKIHNKFLKLCKENGIKIKDIYYCPHNWDDGCDCRKPKPGMFFKAAAEHHFDLTKAIFIGDNERDQEAGDAAGCRIILMKSNGNLLKTVKAII